MNKKLLWKIFPWKRNRALIRNLTDELYFLKEFYHQKEEENKTLISNLNKTLETFRTTEPRVEHFINCTETINNDIKALQIHINDLHIQNKILNTQLNYEKIREKLRKKFKNGEKIKVLFIQVLTGTWKCDSVYKIFANNDSFIPAITKAPLDMMEKCDNISNFELCESYYNKKGMRYISCYSQEEERYIDLTKTFSPDIVIFTYPWDVTHYALTQFTDSLNYYIPYGAMLAPLADKQYNQDFHQLTYKNFYESDIHAEMSRKYSRNKGINTVVSGYPWFDMYKEKSLSNPWKAHPSAEQDTRFKVIWAPHHSLTGTSPLTWSSFLMLANFMLELATRLQDKIIIAFKPHPLLKYKLYDYDHWGKQKADEYYEKWNKHPAGFLAEENEYIDLFKYSDAMILDSVSFLAEYLITEKPMLFASNGENEATWNEFGEQLYQVIEKTTSPDGVTNFLYNLLSGKDAYKEKRNRFYAATFAKPMEHGSVGENIFNSICGDLELS